MKLSDAKIRNCEIREKAYKVFDGKGLHLIVKPNGAKYWRHKYQFNGKEKSLSYGVYPEISLKQARDECLKSRQLLREFKDPSQEKKLAKLKAFQSSETSFKVIAEDWMSKQTWSERHGKRVYKQLENDVFPFIGERPIAEIRPQEVILLLRKVEARDALDVASRILQKCTSIFRYAVQIEVSDQNPANELKGILKTRKVTHVPSIPPEELPGILRAIKDYDGYVVTKLALLFLANTFVRPGELRKAKWDQIDWEDKLWRIPADQMKMGTEHFVPLSKQSIELLEKIKEVTWDSEYIFRAERSKLKFISENTMTFALYRMGYKSRATPHGFRATATSILNENNFNPDAIERQLSHTERNTVRSAYNHHARYLDERRDMMKWWSDYLEKIK